MHIDNVIFLILSKNAYTKFSAGPKRKPPSDCRTASLLKGEILCQPYRGTSDFIRLFFFSEKPPVLPFFAYGFPLPAERYKKHLKTIPLFGGLFDPAAAAVSFVHEKKASAPVHSSFAQNRHIAAFSRSFSAARFKCFSLTAISEFFNHFACQFVPLAIKRRIVAAAIIQKRLHRRSCYSGMPQAAYPGKH